MHMWISDKWQDFELIDCSKGEKLERWGRFILFVPIRRRYGIRRAATRAGTCETRATAEARPAAERGIRAAFRQAGR